MSISTSQLSADGIPIERLVALREQETKRPGSGLSTFRANYRRCLEEYLATLAKATKPSDHQEIFRSFEQAMSSDLASLRSELRVVNTKLVFNRDVLIGLAVGAGFIMPALPSALQVPAASVFGVAGVVYAYADYVGARKRVLAGRPMSWLYLTDRA